MEWRDYLLRLDELFDTELIPIKQAAEKLGFDEKAAKADKRFPIKKVGGRYYVPKVALAKFLSCGTVILIPCSQSNPAL